MKWLPAAILAVGVLVWIVVPGKEEVKRYVANADNAPTMSTRDVSTLISDSGYTRYHMEAPLWQMYEDVEEPYWLFPEGIELEQYDLQMKPESTVVCDSATYFSRKRLWRLDGNVVMVSTATDSFLTQQLFWDQNSRKIYSDSFIHIVRTDRTIEGYGFESDQSMRYYTVRRPTAILPADRRPGVRRDTVATADTAAAAPRGRRARRGDTNSGGPQIIDLRKANGSGELMRERVQKADAEPARPLKIKKSE